MKKIRLDQLVFDLGLTDSREKARAGIMAGLVTVNGKMADKPGMSVPEDARVEMRGAMPYVSRGGLKLEKALKVFPVSPRDLVCLDCGASTGGFTDVMLQNGASKVYAVDVGYGQLAWKLRSDPRVICMERTNIRYLTPPELGEPVAFATADLSFISLRLVLGPVYDLLDDGADMICLVKPQFEAGRDQVGRKGIVRDPAVHRQVIRQVIGYGEENGLASLGLAYSPVTGTKGNIEYLLFMTRKVCNNMIGDKDVERVVEESHRDLG